MHDKHFFEKAFDPEKEDECQEVLKKYIQTGGTFQKIFGFSDHLLEERYALGFDLYHKEEYEEAIQTFSYLVTLNPYSMKYWLALAAAQVREEDFDGALVSYLTAATVDIKDPRPHFFSAGCYLKTGEKEQARQALEMAIEIAKHDHHYRAIEDSAYEQLKTLS